MMGERERAVAFVVARLSSSRLPEKQLRPIGGSPIIDWVITSLKQAQEVDEVVLATVAEPANQPLREVAQRLEVPLFWYEGAVDDVVGRLRHAADRHRADICLIISADCPLMYAPAIDELVRQLRADAETDTLFTPPLENGETCLLEGVQVARRAAWHKADELSDRPELREHQFPVIGRRPEHFRSRAAFLDPSVYGTQHRLSVDTWADLEFMETLYRRLSAEERPFTLPEVVRLLRQRPQLRTLNHHVHQRRLIESIHPVLFAVDAGGQYGYGHFMRCRELAGQVVERLSWPATFLVDDERAAQMARACGFQVLWGAVARPARPIPSDGPWIGASAAESMDGHDLAVVDISVQRAFPERWRTAVAPARPVVVIDRDDGWAAEADLIVYPGVSGRGGRREGDSPVVASGLRYVILRREVQRYQGLGLEKSIDVLAYLYDPDQREAVRRAASEQGWNVEILTGFSEAFPELLARSKVFLSGYGQSFYEALALGAHPVTWPLSPAHRADACAFYDAVGLSPAFVQPDAGPAAVIAPLLEAPAQRLPELSDGTPQILARLSALCEDME